MADLCLEFVNSRWYADHGENKDILDDPNALRDFFAARGLEAEGDPAGTALEELRRLRAELTAALKRLVEGKAPDPAFIDQLNQYLGGIPLIRELQPAPDRPGAYQLRETPSARDWNWILAETAASFAALWTQDLSRLRLCENPECGWFFFDTTKSRTKRCCDESCAGLVKMRKYRARQKNDPIE